MKQRAPSLIASLFVLVTLIPASASATNKTSPRRHKSIPTHREFAADFSKSSTRGVGVRLSQQSSGLYVDLRLKGYSGHGARLGENRAEFVPATGIKVKYEAGFNEVKETIELSQRGPQEFRYKITAPGLKQRQDEDTISFDSRRELALFRIHGLKVWDAGGKDIPASLTLEGGEAVVRLDGEALSTAQVPITVDPIISGFLGSAPHARKLFETSDGRLILFHLVSAPDGWNLAYSVSTDRGETWSAPVLIGITPGAYGSDAIQGPDDTFYLTYPAGPYGSAVIAFRRLTPLPDGTWSIGVETAVGTGETMLFPRPSIADLGQGSAGRKLALGFGRKNVVGTYEYVVAFSEDSGSTWPLTVKCDDAGNGSLAAQGSRLLCLSPGGASSLEMREWLGATWGLPTDLPLAGSFSPSTVVTDDGRLHLVVGYWGKVNYSWLSPAGSQWSTPVELGLGSGPVISTTGTSLHVFAALGVHYSEARVHSYTSTDGVTWAEGMIFSGRPFTHVLDVNETWAFTDDYGDALFSLTDAQGEWGNRIGTSSTLHKLDAIDKKFSMSFEQDTAGVASSITIWVTASNAPTYRVGLQSDCSAVDPLCYGFPSGSWLQDSTLTGSWGDVSPSNTGMGITPLSVNLGESANLDQGVRYHVVIQPVPDALGSNNPSSDKWMSVETVGADVGAEGSLRVLTNSGTGWLSVANEVPRFLVASTSGALLIQDLRPSYSYPAHKYSVPGESFVMPRAFSPTSLKVYLTKEGNPTFPITIRLLNEAGDEVWSAASDPEDEGWLSIPVSGVTMPAGGRYRLVIDDPTPPVTYWSPWNRWSLGTSNGHFSSWDGSASSYTRAYDRPGINDLTQEASDDLHPDSEDFWAFNSSTSDVLYVGDDRPFDFARVWGSSDGNVSTAFAYWNGSSWTTLSTIRNSYGSGTDWSFGFAEWLPPSDWTNHTVDGRSAYWVRITNSASSVTPLRIFRTTSIRDFRSPTAAPRGSTYIPVAWEDYDLNGVYTWAYDVLAPNVASTSPLRFADVTSTALVSAGWNDSDSGVDPSTLTMKIDGSEVEADIVGSSISADGSSLSPGIHHVEVGGRDLAGNQGSDVFIFTIVSFSPDPATASLAETVMAVNPQGSSPGPSTITFASPLVTTTAFYERINASTRVGHSDLNRPFSLGAVEILFENESGATATVLAEIAPSLFSYPIAVLAPSADTLEAYVGAGTATIPDVTVSVPDGFSTAGSTATLRDKSVDLGPSNSAQTTVLSSEIEDPTPVFGSISVCMQRRPDGSYLHCQWNQRSELSAYIQGKGRGVAIPALPPADPDSEATPPKCVSSTSAEGCYSLTGSKTDSSIHGSGWNVILGCPVYTFRDSQGIVNTKRNLCDLSTTETSTTHGYASAYLNAWVFKTGTSGPHALWQQNHLELPADGDSCHSSKAGKVKASGFRMVSNAQSLDPVTPTLTSGTFRTDTTNQSDQVVRLGASPSGPNEQSTNAGGIKYDESTDRTYLLKNGYDLDPLPVSTSHMSYYEIAKGSIRDALGSSVSNAATSLDAWELIPGQALASTVDPLPDIGSARIQMAAGTEFGQGEPGYGFIATLAFQFIVDYRECAP